MTFSKTADAIKRADINYHMHGNTSIANHSLSGPNIIKSASGMRIKDIYGNEYLDSIAGLWCMTLGYGREEIGEVAKESISSLGYTHTFAGNTCESTALLAEELVNLFNSNVDNSHISKVFFGHSGSDANDTNIKLMKLYNNLRGKFSKKKIIAREGGYHGVTTMATALTGIPAYHSAFDAPIDEIVRISAPSYYRFHKEGETEVEYTDRLINELEDVIEREGADNIGAFIAEPVMGTGGMFVPPKGYFGRVQEVLKENDIILIVDEVVTGFGRTGEMFGSKTFGIAPDMVTLAKGLTSAYAPLSASLVSKKIWSVLESSSDRYGPIMHGFTYGGHPVSTAIASKAIEILKREDLVNNAKTVGNYLLERVKEATYEYPYVGEVRGIGAMLGVEYVARKANRTFFKKGVGPHKAVADECLKHGLISRALPFVDVTNMAPPLIINKEDADECVMRFSKALESVKPTLDEMYRKSY
ncbi:aminotransferase class III-fold pyridoxal phosphate-dependent enzyme [Halomonas sp. KAO]|uniref:aminotransferase class III-fold pyridoxal phosphate-dependent enzyme n=1 Tax=Halomonas sp. KAO TaxID=2783858 RepID=UPI00189DDBAA|nr:aminotransferase class III-fold pyridoxal phosphate-dependent enzyme [Halomonas sp. KAO]MBF7052850.1 aminotransferase class III-fold pyridoxal phosphate-dependent enzyme [Halomonas sp. KAO]